MVLAQTKTDLDLVAHLLRRAGFGADRAEIERYAGKSYDEIVDDLVHPERFPQVEDDLLGRFYPHLAANKDNGAVWNGRWMFRMVNTERPLEEKMTLFWHGILATGWTKSEHTPSMVNHMQMLRDNCMANFRTILLELSRDPAMIFWLDNNENHGYSINENYGREILELFSMGIGNYTEDDIKNAARAFTGWTFTQPLPLYPFGHFEAEFIYARMTTMRVKRSSWVIRATSTARTSSTSSPAKKRLRASLPDISTPSLSRTSHRFQRGAYSRRKTLMRFRNWSMRGWSRTQTSATLSAPC